MRSVTYIVLFVLMTACVPRAEETTRLSDPAPPLSIAAWIKGEPVKLAEGKGKHVYVVEFWATWCPPCRYTIPHLTELQKKYRDKGLTVIGVSTEHGEVERVRSFVKDMGDKMEYTVAVDGGDEVGKTSEAYLDKYKVKGIPAAFVIDKSGNIIWHGHPLDGLDQAVKEAIEAAGSTQKLSRKAESSQ